MKNPNKEIKQLRLEIKERQNELKSKRWERMRIMWTCASWPWRIVIGLGIITAFYLILQIISAIIKIGLYLGTFNW